MKKFISLVLALVMALSLTTVAWGAATEVGTYADFKTAVQAGGEVKLTANIEGDGIVIDNSVTIDLNGFSYTINGKTVGSNHTETLGMQINESAGTVVIKNGSIIGSDAATKPASTCGVTGCTAAGHTDVDIPNNGVKMVIQNYADLTLSGVTVTGTAAAKYVVSNNCGDVVLENTTINATGTNVAFDTCKYASYAAPTVTVKGTSVINGKVEIAGGDLEVEGGTVNGEIAVVTGGAAADVTISGGTFASALPTGVTMASGTELISDGAGGYIAAAKTSGSTTTNTVKKDGYSLVSMDNTLSRVVAADFTKTTISPKTVTSGNVTTTTYYADRYVIDGTVCWACDASIAEAKLVKNGVVVAYLTTDTAVGAGVTKVASAFVAAKAEPACGEYDVNTYVVGGKNYVVGTSEYVLYNGLVVGIGGEATAEPHDFTKKNITTDTKGAIVSIKCDNCKKSFTVVGVGKVPATYAGTVDTTTLAANGNVILMGTATTATSTVTGTVNSADTFDAGIAMYVGMSVMAAAGSAVVIGKKKD